MTEPNGKANSTTNLVMITSDVHFLFDDCFQSWRRKASFWFSSLFFSLHASLFLSSSSFFLSLSSPFILDAALVPLLQNLAAFGVLQ